jgi:hypothetical protein
MMAALYEVLGWCGIAAGTWLTFRATRNVVELKRVGKHENVGLGLRRGAWRNVWFSPCALVWGVFWVSYRWMHDGLIWLPIAYLAVFVICEFGSWFWPRKKVGPPRQAAG